MLHLHSFSYGDIRANAGRSRTFAISRPYASLFCVNHISAGIQGYDMLFNDRKKLNSFHEKAIYRETGGHLNYIYASFSE